MNTALLIGPQHRAALVKLRDRAAEHPVDMRGLAARIAEPEGKREHMRQMTRQTVDIPVGYTVTFSIETGHPCGVARHLSVSRAGRLPHPAAVWMIAEELGFTGAIEHCVVWPEQLEGHGQAVNVVQPVGGAAGTA